MFFEVVVSGNVELVQGDFVDLLENGIRVSFGKTEIGFIGWRPESEKDDEVEALLTQLTVLKKTERFPDTELAGIRYGVLVFGMHDSLVTVYRTLGDVVEAIDKRCRTKRHLTEIGYSFRYKKKTIDFDVTI